MWPHRLLVLALVPYATWLVFAYDYHFLDGVNLVFHEAGHMFLALLGRTLHVLGGSLGQLFFPIACAFYFARGGQRFEAAVCGLWLGESVMYLALYLADAKAMRLPLVGGHIHDWNWLLGSWGLLEACGWIGALLHGAGSLLVIGSLISAASLAFGLGATADPMARLAGDAVNRPH